MYSIYEWSIVYITIYAFVCSFIPNKKTSKKVFIFLASLHLFIIQGLRSEFVGGDVQTYKNHFNNQSFIGVFDVIEGAFEPAYHYLTLFLSKMGISFQFFMIMISLFTFIVLGIALYKFSPHPYISFLLYLFFGIYDFGFSGLRQTIAMSIVLISFYFILEKKPKKYYFTILIATLFHSTALFFIVFYVLINNKLINKLYWYFYPVLLVIILGFGSRITYFATVLFNEKLLRSYSSSFTSGFGMDELVLIALFIIGALLYFLMSQLNDNKNYKSLLLLTSVAMLVQLLSPYSYFFIRFNLYFYHFVILFAPLVYDIVLNLVSKKEKLLNIFIKAVFALIFFIVIFRFYNGYLEQNPHLILPHSFYWEYKI